MRPTAYFFATCAPGAEPALKAQAARACPDWRFAYSRPGFVTFRTPGEVAPDLSPDLRIARAWGASHGPVAEADLAARVAELIDGGPARAHVYAREGVDVDLSAAQDALRALPGLRPGPPEDGELVVSVILGAADQPWLGLHRHGPGRGPLPGGAWDVAAPTQAPSRAWQKRAEALAWSRLPLRRGDRALEIGSAPGGGALVLLERGVSVVGVDPLPMAPGVLGWPGPASFEHRPVPVGALDRASLPPGIQWLFVDVHLAAPVAIRSVQRLFPPYRASLLGAVFTLKLPDWGLLERLPRWLEQLAQYGLQDLTVACLPGNGQELTVAGWTALGRKTRTPPGRGERRGGVRGAA